MQWIQQSIAFYKNNLRHALYLACLSLIVLVAASMLGLIGALVASVGFSYLQTLVFLSTPRHHRGAIESKLRASSLHFSLLGLSLLLLPTNIMCGSLIGILFSDQSWWVMLVMTLGIGPVIGLFYLCIAYTIGFIVLEDLKLRVAFDRAFAMVLKNSRKILGYLGVLFLLLVASIIPLGFGLVFSLPILLYSCSFSFEGLRSSAKAATSATT